jgi:phosphatidylglycerophosphate synthase
MEEALVVFIVFGSITATVIVIGMAIYFAKRLEHKQILAAIEKGTPLSELRPPKPHKPVGTLWIRHITAGITMLAIALGFALVGPGPKDTMLFVAFILCGVGIANIIRGILYRKYQPQIQSSDKGSDTINNKLSGPGSLRPDEQ